MSKITFALESIEELKFEMMPLLREHFKEISANKDIDLNPDFKAYGLLERTGGFKVWVARNNGVLVGYCAFFLSNNIHYQDSYQAIQDVLFIRKAYRNTGLGYDLIRYCDEQLKEMKVQVVYHHVKFAHDFGTLLEAQGYNKVEKIYSKRLDK